MKLRLKQLITKGSGALFWSLRVQVMKGGQLLAGKAHGDFTKQIL